MQKIHIPVLQKEVIQYLDPKPNKNFIDTTLGKGGHTAGILERNGPKGKVLGIDRDPEIIRNLKLPTVHTQEIRNLEKRIILACDNFANLKEIVQREKFKQVQGILFDLGMSSWHLEKSQRGFSFLKNEPLDMRYSPESPLTAAKIVNYWSRLELERILKEYGQERFSQKIVQKIIEARRIKVIKTTAQLVAIVREAVPVWYQNQKIHFATRTFQALRIAVNNELDNLKKALPQAVEILEKNGRLVVVSFHSLEDRIVKNFFREKSKEDLLKILTKKPVVPTPKEIRINPRSRSAKLRAAVKI